LYLIKQKKFPFEELFYGGVTRNRPDSYRGHKDFIEINRIAQKQQ